MSYIAHVSKRGKRRMKKYNVEFEIEGSTVMWTRPGVGAALIYSVFDRSKFVGIAYMRSRK